MEEKEVRILRKRDTKGLVAEGKLEQSRLRERERERMSGARLHLTVNMINQRAKTHCLNPLSPHIFSCFLF